MGREIHFLSPMDLILTSVLIGIGLAMDCFAVSLATGGHATGPGQGKTAVILGLVFGFFQGGMALVGWAAGAGVVGMISPFDHVVAALLLFAIGGKMAVDGIRDGGEEVPANVMNPVAVLILAVATSIDALAVGISFAFLDVAPLVPVVIIGLVAFVFSFVGVFIGGRLGRLLGRRMDIAGGAILILIGIRVLLGM